MQTIELPKQPVVLQNIEEPVFDVTTKEGLSGFFKWVEDNRAECSTRYAIARAAHGSRVGRMLASPPPPYDESREAEYIAIDKAMHQDKLNDGYGKRRQAQAERASRRFGGVL